MSRAVRLDLSSPEPSPSSHLASWYMPGLSDALGDRLLMFDNTATASLELLRLRREFTDVPAFEAAVRQRMRVLERFEHPGLAKVRAFTSLGDGEGVALVSNHTVGQRLSEVLHAARGPALGLDLIRQLTPVLADLQRQGDDVAHGILTPERIIVTPEGRLVMVEHVLGSALQAAALPQHRLQSDFGLIARAHDGALGRRGDVVQLGLAALSLVLGRRIDPSEYPLNVAALLDELELIDAPGASDFARLRRWMQHALQLGGRAFGSAGEAHEALREVLGHRDDLPRENVIVFPSPAVFEPPIEISSREAAPAPPPQGVQPAAPPPPPEPELDVAAMWRAAQEIVGGFAPSRRQADGAAPASPDGAYSTERIRLTLDLRPTRLTRAFAALLPARVRILRGMAAQVPQRSGSMSAPLAVLAVAQTIVLTLLLAVPPVPERVIVTRVVEVPAPSASGAIGAAPAAGAANPAPAATVTQETVPQRPPTFTEHVVQGIRAAPAAIGRGLAAAWRATADFVGSLFSRPPANGR